MRSVFELEESYQIDKGRTFDDFKQEIFNPALCEVSAS